MPGHARPAARVLRIASNRPPYLWIMFQHTHNPVQTGPASAPSSQEFGRRWIQAKRYKLLAEHRARRGLHHPGNFRPYGHTKDRRSLVDLEAKMLLQAAKSVDQGKAVWAIAEQWTQRGVPTVQGGRALGRWGAQEDSR
jgi:hypothetical protein